MKGMGVVRSLVWGFFSLFFSLISAENEISAITGNSVISHLSPRNFCNRMTSAPFGSVSVFDPQSVGTALGLELHLFFFQNLISTIASKKPFFYFKTRLEKGCDLSLWTGRERGLCGGGANCKCLSLMSSVINKASEHSSPRRASVQSVSGGESQCLSAPACTETELLVDPGSFLSQARCGGLWAVI